MAPNPLDKFTFLTRGGIIQRFQVGDKNIVLNLPRAESYGKVDFPYLGQTIGRVANRVSGAKIDNLNGRSYSLPANDGEVTLHGGDHGFGEKTFQGPTAVTRHGCDAVLFNYTSQDGEEGFPGTVEMSLWYIAQSPDSGKTDETILDLEFEAKLVDDNVDETAVSLTNHSYFNIGDEINIAGTQATLFTNTYQDVDDNKIPTGELKQFPDVVPGQGFTLGRDEPAFDHCLVMNTEAAQIPLDTREGPMTKLCSFYHPITKIHFEISSTEPAFQFYTGQFVDVKASEHTPAVGPRSGFCVEASRYINAVNMDNCRGMVVLKKGQVWGSRTSYRAWTE